MVCSIDTSRISAYGYDQRIEVFGEKGMAVVENERNHGVKLYTENGEDQSVFKHSFPQRYPKAYLDEIKIAF